MQLFSHFPFSDLAGSHSQQDQAREGANRYPHEESQNTLFGIIKYKRNDFPLRDVTWTYVILERNTFTVL